MRIIAYIDGLNLYYGIRDYNRRPGTDPAWRSCLWVDLPALAQEAVDALTRLPGPSQLLGTVPTVTETKYFTAMMRGPSDRLQRQTNYIDALRTLPNLTVYLGHIDCHNLQCRTCGSLISDREEKMTDVQIAVQLLRDAVEDRFDAALLVSADSDLVPPLAALREMKLGKPVFLAWPPNRHSNDLQRHSDGRVTITKAWLKACQLPDPVTATVPGSLTTPLIYKPAKWV